MSKATTYVIVGIIFGMLAIVGQLEYRDSVEADQRYCYMVEQGHWPDYDSRYKRDCGGNNPPKFRENKSM